MTNSLVLCSTVEERKNLHRRLGLTLDRPLLRTANAVCLKNIEAVASRTSGIFCILAVSNQSRSLSDIYSFYSTKMLLV